LKSSKPTLRSSFAERIRGLVQSDIRRMSRECELAGGINLGQGICDQPVPDLVKEAAVDSVRADRSIYSKFEGIDPLRAKIAEKMHRYNGIRCDPDREVVVTVGSTGGFVAAALACVESGDEVILFSPFYGYHLNILKLCQASFRFVTIRPPDWSFDERELEQAFGERTRAIVINTPSNPCGKVFSREELELIGKLCERHDVLAITDEIYEYILYDGAEHVSIATLPGMAERTITISGLSKTWSATGWRIGWALASAELTLAIRKVHDFLTVGAPAPLQEAAADALAFGPEYFAELARDYAARRALILDVLSELGFEAHRPRGAYYVMTGVQRLQREDEDDVAFAIRLLRSGGVATVPGSSFYPDPLEGRGQIRFCFAKRMETLQRAAQVLRERLS
jgi:aspartate/methionine/tyrosine aminotransferase